MREEADSAWAEKEALGVGGRGGKGQQEQNAPRAKKLRRAPPEGSAQFYFMGQMEAGGRSRMAQQEGGRKDNRRQRKRGYGTRGNQKRLRREESREYLLLDYDLIE